MAAFVIDASATLPWRFADEATEATNAVLTHLRTGDEAIVGFPAADRSGLNVP
jgi:hypothetical protein